MEQLSGLDLAFVRLERDHRPMHVGAVLVFESQRGTDPDRVARLLAERAEQVQRLTLRPGGRLWPPGSMEWVPDTAFDAAEHIAVTPLRQRADLPAAIASIMAEPLSHDRPPWQVHVLGCPTRDWLALLVKLHHSLADGAGAGSVIASLLDDPPKGPTRSAGRSPGPADGPEDGWLRAATRLPARAVEAVTGWGRQGARDGAVAVSTLASVRPTALGSPLTNVLESSRYRCWASVRLDADAVHRTRKRLGGTLHDVVLSLVAGGVREWLCQHGDESVVNGGWTPRVFIPVSVRQRRAARHDGGNHLSGYLCPLPVNEPSPIARLSAIRTAMRRNKLAGPSRGAGAFPLLAHSLPAIVHQVVTPLLGRAAPLLYDLMVTTVPVPDVPARLDGAELREVYPIAPLASGHVFSVAVAVYRGGVHVSLFTDGEVLPRPERLADAIQQAALDLEDAAGLQDTEELHSVTAQPPAPRTPSETSIPSSERVEEAGSGRTHASIVIHAAPAQVMDAIADFSRYQEWIAEVRAADVLEMGENGRAQQVRLTLDVGPMREVQVHAYRWQERSVTWSLVSSRMLSSLEGRYTVSPAGDGCCRVDYALSVQPRVRLIEVVKRRAESVVIERALVSLKRHVELCSGPRKP